MNNEQIRFAIKILDFNHKDKEKERITPQEGFLEIIAPFRGFYNTWHGGKVENTARHYYTDDNDIEIKEDNTDYKKTYIQYCKDWVDALSREIKDYDFIKDISIKFKELESPKYYNFENDRLVMEINAIAIQKIQDLIIKDHSKELEKYLKENFTSYDGFSPNYPNNTKEFLLVKQDHNTRKVYFKIFLESVLEIETETLNELVDEVDIIMNEK